MYLSLMPNVRIVYSSRSLHFPLDDKQTSWCLLSATGIPENLVENYVVEGDISDKLIEMLSLPFFSVNIVNQVTRQSNLKFLTDTLFWKIIFITALFHVLNFGIVL